MKITRVAALGTLALLVGCTALVEEEVARFHFKIDALEALQSIECQDLYGTENCLAYPNPNGCFTQTVQVMRDGAVFSSCRDRYDNVISAGPANAMTTALIFCKASLEGLGHVVCYDFHGQEVVNTKYPRQATMRRIGSGWKSNIEGAVPGVGVIPNTPNGIGTPGSGQPHITPQTPRTPGTPGDGTPGDGTPGDGTPGDGTPGDGTPGDGTPGASPPVSGGAGTCTPENVAQLFQTELNAVLAANGVTNWQWTVPANLANPSAGFFAGATNGSVAYGISGCDALLPATHLLRQTWGTKYKFCREGYLNGKDACRCYRLTNATLEASCKKLVADCYTKPEIKSQLLLLFSEATRALFQSSYSRPLTTGTGAATPSTPTTPPSTPTTPPFVCLGSPLVFDLAGDGVQPTSVTEGVNFDLLNVGKFKTAWIANDDALLVFDRDSNGTIDNGSELFGPAFDGALHSDGFAALAQLDTASYGGNGNGILEAGDFLFDHLQLWQDTNGDGLSQRSELSALAAHNITAINVAPTARTHAPDSHGNDLGIRGSFQRKDGKLGSVVDVLFVTGR